MVQHNCMDTISGSPQSYAQSPLSGARAGLSWRMWLAQGRALLVGDARRLWAVMLTWQRRAHERAHLAGLDDRMLADIGLTRSEASRIARKPFWKA